MIRFIIVPKRKKRWINDDLEDDNCEFILVRLKDGMNIRSKICLS